MYDDFTESVDDLIIILTNCTHQLSDFYVSVGIATVWTILPIIWSLTNYVDDLTKLCTSLNFCGRCDKICRRLDRKVYRFTCRRCDCDDLTCGRFDPEVYHIGLLIAKMYLWDRCRSIIWSEWFWFPPNASWSLLENKEGNGIYYPQLSDFYVSVGIAFVLYLIRQLYEKYVVAPFGSYLGLKYSRTRKAPHNDILETEYRCKKKSRTGRYTEMEERQVERWFRLRRSQDRSSKMKKFTETGWRFTYYLGIFIYGLTVLWNKSWFWDSKDCWYGFPTHHLESTIYWYYMIELGFYLSLMFSQFVDVRRKDFIEMFIHHIATVLLLSFSYVGNFIRVGTLVLCLHDFADYWIEAAKMAKYVKADWLCDILFALFAVIWFVTRLICYPLIILNTTWFESTKIQGFFPSLVFFNGWLCLLLVLHTYWFSLIIRVIYLALTKNTKIDDVRSSTDEPMTDDLEQNHVGNNVKNNVKVNGKSSVKVNGKNVVVNGSCSHNHNKYD